MATSISQPLPDPEDMFADTRMSFGDHIEDLRSHLIRAVVGFILGLIVCVLPPIGPWAVKFITYPVEAQLQAFYDRYTANQYEAMKEELARTVRPLPVVMDVHVPTLKAILEGKKPDPLAKLDLLPAAVDRLLIDLGFDCPDDAARSAGRDWAQLPVEIPDPIALSKVLNDINRVVRPKRLSTMNVQEAFIVYFKIGLLCGFVLASPWVFYQLWSFVAVGLYAHEKKLVNYYLPISLALFLAGFFVCEFLALPKAIEALLWFNEWLGFEPDLRLNEWLSFAIIMPLVFGLSFQTPIVMMFLYKIGIADVQTFRDKRRLAYFLMAIFAAIITPSTDVPTMCLLWVPMCLLYEAGIWLCIMQPRTIFDESDESELDEMIGV